MPASRSDPEDANTPAAPLLAADVEMYASKRAGRTPDHQHVNQGMPVAGIS